MALLMRILQALVVAVVVYLICVFFGGVLLPQLQVSIAVAVGRFIDQYASVFAVLAFIWSFVRGGGWPK